MNELMERLARANPVPPDEPPTPDDERAAEARLERIVADVVPDERPRPAPRLRRLAPAAGLLAVLAIAAVIAIDLLDTDEEGGGIVERAVAAVSQEDVIYASVERWTTRSVALDPGTDTSPDERVFARTWLWREGGRSHYLAYDLRPDGRPGRLRSEVVSTPERMVWFDAKGEQVLSYNRDRDRPGDEPPADDPGENGFPGFDPFSDPGAQLREHVDSGRLRVDGRTTVRGRTAFRLVARDGARSAPDEDFGTVVYLVDARTYLPLEMRQRMVFDHSDVPGGGRERATIRVEYLRYEALPVNDETEKLLERGAGRRP